ncbi:MAG: SET domain-containing protein-lysine N-methyltransferase [Desulfobulbaceae bacterium]|nr:SET domain-containing protein-lysine N-methyltransferase [Desulfobulbaceae bacterium]HIJ78555.1 SET domain-containing protein [Deltaproteobacteria bacterium]
MLTVKTYLAPSLIHGIGLFAQEPIPARTVVWKFDHVIDKVYNEPTFLKLCSVANDPTLQHLLNASYKRGGRYFYLTDNARFINHTENNPNIEFIDDYCEIAIRPIAAHEEIMENYLHSYDATDFFFQEISNPDPTYYLHNLRAGRPADAYRKNLS